MYILVKASKGSYDRPIEINILETYNTLEEDSQELINSIYEDGEILEKAIKEQKKFVGDDRWNPDCYLDYTNGLLTYYSTGCPADNEYDGTTIQIFEAGE